MQGPWLLLVLVAGVQAFSSNGTLEEVQVSSQPLRVAASSGRPGQEADVRPLPRKAREESGVGVIPAAEGGRNRTETEREGKMSDKETGRGHMKKMKKTLKKMMPYLLVPGMMALGYAPFILASLKMFVMNAVMLNMMAFNAAIFITLRNMVFGPRVGQHVKYYNFGYSHKKKHHHH